MRILCKIIAFCALSILIAAILISSILYFISTYIHFGISPLHIMVLSIFTGLLTGAILIAIFPTKKGEPPMSIHCDLCDSQIQTKLNFICPDCVAKLNKSMNGNNHHHEEEEELQPVSKVSKKNTKRHKPSKKQRSTVSTIMSKITGLNIGGKL